MNEDALRSEHDQVTAELAAARIEYASLGAKIDGLVARQAGLEKALHALQPAAAPVEKFRTDAIVAVVTQAGRPLSVHEVITGLRDSGRPHETSDNVSSDLAYLAEKGRIVRVKRGVYAAQP
jgi:Transcriptional regulator, AbiEi antitoxin